MIQRSLYIVMYDITDSGVLHRVATILTKEGFERINYSVWVGSFDPGKRVLMKTQMLESLNLPKAEGSRLFVLPITRSSLKKMRSLNGRKPENLDYWLGDLKTLFC